MSELSSVKNNSFFSFLSISFRYIPNIAVFWILARFWGPDIFGKFSYAHTLANTFLLIADFGFDLLLTTEIARDRKNAVTIFREYFWIKMTLAAAALIGMFLFVYLKSGNIESLLLGFIFGFYMVFNTISNFYVAMFKGFEKLSYDARVSIATNLFLLISAGTVFVLLHGNIYLIALSYVFSRIVGFLFSLRLTRNVMPDISYRILFTDFRGAMRKALLYGLLILSISLLYQLDTILLGLFKSDREVGVYNAVKNLLLVPYIIPGVAYSALLPTLARLFKESRESWIAMNKIFFKIIYWITLPIAVFFFAYPKQIIYFVYSSKNYSSAIPLLGIFSVVLFIRCISDYMGVMLITSNKQKIQVYTAFSGIFLSIILNIFIVPKYGIYGAAFVLLIINIFVLFVYMYNNFEVFYGHIINNRYLLLLLAGVIIALLVHINMQNIFFLGILVVFVLLVGVSFMLFFSSEERSRILEWKVNFNFIRK